MVKYDMQTTWRWGCNIILRGATTGLNLVFEAIDGLWMEEILHQLVTIGNHETL